MLPIVQDSPCRSLNTFAFDLGPRSKEIILYSINKQDNQYAFIVHKNAAIERREIQ